ncbi:MAG: hypothetical protein CMK25_10185 [Porticoccaceae bacterium]|nr:hypothetical protein [Porticoccaceae bacterium]MDG2116163.1 hypothetical protein [Porticoccaceae bacterium]
MLKTILLAAIFALFIASLLFEPLSHIDMKSLLLVIGGAVIFALTGKNRIQRISLFGDGAVTTAWIGFIVGSISILMNLNLQTPQWFIGLDAAFAVALMTLLYGYLFKAIATLVINQLKD